VGLSREGGVSDDPFLSVVIPVFEGEHVVRATIEAVQAHAARRGWPIEIVVGYARGNDRTGEILDEACSDYDNVSIVDTTDHFGKGGAVRGAMARTRGSVRCFIDADSGVSFDQVDRALELLAGYDIVIGSRYVPGGSPGRRSLGRIMLSRGGNLLMRAFLRLPFADTRAPLKVYRGEVADCLFPMLRLEGFGFDTELLFLARKLDLRVLEFPVRWESGDETTVKIHRDAVRSLLELLEIKWHWVRGGYDVRGSPEKRSDQSRRTA
jgi:dolichyl-phosphate beta-glucosyltransferase